MSGILNKPLVGEVFDCEFPSCFQPPEMVKRRPVVVISPKSVIRQGLVTVVPISMTAPEPLEPWHCEVPLEAMPLPYQDKAGVRYAKCDMVYNLSVTRLNMVGIRVNGKRESYKGRVSLATLQEIRRCAAIALGIGASLYRDEILGELRAAEDQTQKELRDVLGAAAAEAEQAPAEPE